MKGNVVCIARLVFKSAIKQSGTELNQTNVMLDTEQCVASNRSQVVLLRTLVIAGYFLSEFPVWQNLQHNIYNAIISRSVEHIYCQSPPPPAQVNRL